MRKSSLIIIVLSFLAILSTPLYAKGPPEGKGPDKHDVCSPLKAPGVTKGLFGLCVAYCEAGASSEQVLINYNKKKKESDPEMPCLDEQEPTLDCACWNTLTADEIGVDFSPSSCSLDPSLDSLFYADEAGQEFIIVGPGGCAHFNTLTGANTENYLLTPEQELECRDEVLDLAERDFATGEFDCLPD